MGKPRWWVCADCRSLNDLPANRCYHCRSDKPEDPTLIDDQYEEVRRSQSRVGITVDLSRLGDLTAPDPVETQEGGGMFDAFTPQDGRSAASPSGPAAALGQMRSPRSPAEPSGPPMSTWEPGRPPAGQQDWSSTPLTESGGPTGAASGSSPGPLSAPSTPSPRPLRDPAPRSIAELGGRPWADGDPSPGVAMWSPARAPQGGPSAAPPPPPWPYGVPSPPDPTGGQPHPMSGALPAPYPNASGRPPLPPQGAPPPAPFHAPLASPPPDTTRRREGEE